MINVNGRSYRLPARPVAVICFDGCDPSYLADASARGLTPAITAMSDTGFSARGLSAMPSFTNPNNVSIVCGAPPAVHGISGNYWYDRETGREVMMIDEGPLSAPTILAEMAEAGVPVAAVTAKDKLRKALAVGLAGKGRSGIAFSAEKADHCTVDSHGISAADAVGSDAVPEQYSANLSLFVLNAGIRLLTIGRADLLYLSLSDFVQHSHAPGAPESDAFLQAVDQHVGRLVAMGATVGIVADHGMTDMSLADGTPNVLYLGDILDEQFGRGRTKVICPITDPFVRHHGALGGFVRIHVLDDLDHQLVRDFVAARQGIHTALLRDEACALLALPRDREGDVTVIAVKGVALGTRASEHDLSQLVGSRLRSHGGFAEQDIPFLLSRPLRPDFRAAMTGQIYNYDIFHFALNGT